MDEEQLRVRFITKDDAIRVTDTAIAVPTKLTRKGLSEVINHLIGSGESRSFEFIIEEKLLRLPLSRFIEKYNVSGEDVVTVEYFEALGKPEPQQSSEAQEWIGALTSLAHRAVLAGSYDGRVTAYSVSSGQAGSPVQVHQASIRSIAADGSAGDYVIVTGGKDHAVRFCKAIPEDDNLKVVPAAVGLGHSNSVDAVALNIARSQALSGGWDGQIRVWAIPPQGFQTTDRNGENVRKKKQKTSQETESITELQLTAASVLTGHHGNVSGVAWKDTSSSIISCGWDRSVRTWDLEKEMSTFTAHGDRPATSLSVSPVNTKLVATSHPDRAVRLWDLEASGKSYIKATLSSHKEWVSQCAFSPFHEFHLLSCSYDGVVKVWDIRGSVPLVSLQAHNGKALSVAWIDANRFVSGGSDCKVKFFAAGSKTSEEDGEE